ncbi:MAG: c-type cytochrome domain-containing protein, partial [Planctomycetota bacterium]|nr:c-type cytochrome domain-containing protein [Planctomycetota bacterium]
MTFTVAVAKDEPVDFNRQIRPILSDRCFKCHGPDSESRESNLRLDFGKGKEGPFAKRDGNPAITPGSLENSTLWQKIHDDTSPDRMPPPTSNKPPLSLAEKKLFKKWILEGAQFNQHWSFLTLE